MKILILTTLIFLYNICYSQIPAGYYNSAEGREGEGLRQALHEIISNHTVVTYNSLWSHFQNTDKKPNGKVWDIYSDIPGGTPAYEYSFSSDQCGNYSQEGDCYNREHSWPESWYSSAGSPMNTDLFHVYPTDGFVNSKRSNYPFGEVGNVTWQSTNGGKLGTSNYPGWSGFIVFEPIDEYKGDLARTYFYMSTRYFSQDSGWAENEMVDGANIKDKPMEMLLEWHEQDPVSQKELDRNNAIYNIQGNRNPFIDRPIFANAIWDPAYSVINENENDFAINFYPNPANDFLNIGTLNSLDVQYINIYNITGILKLHIPSPVIEKLDVSDLSSGVYIIKTQLSEGRVISQKLTIIK